MKCLLPLFILFSISISHAFGQNATPATGETGCRPEIAKLIVDQQASESRSVPETDKRVNILIRVANFLWKYDQPTARSHFTEAYKVATDRYTEKGIEKKEGGDGLVRSAPDYRFMVIEAIAPKDGEWAKKLIDAILAEYEKEAEKRDNEWDKNRDLNSILMIATASVKTNPDLSWYLFRRLMAKPLDSHWYFTLYDVAREDRQFADQLYLELLRAYQTASPRRFLFLSAYPFGNERILSVDKYQFGTSVPEGFAPSQGLQLRFLNAIFQNFASFAADPANVTRPPDRYRQPEPIYMVSALQELQPIVVESFPALLQRYAEVSALANSMLNGDMRDSLRTKEEINKELSTDFEKRLAELEKADADGKLEDHMITSLITWQGEALTEEQFKKVLPWLDKINDKSARESTANYFWFMRTKRAVKDKRYDEAESFALKVPELEFRSMLMFEIAEAVSNDLKDRGRSLEILSEVEKLARRSEDSIAKARVLLGLSYVYEKTDHLFAINALSDAVNTINHLDDPDILSTSLTRQIKADKHMFFALFEMPGYGLEEVFKQVSKNDLEIPYANAKSLQDRYFRTLAVIGVAQNCIDNKKESVKRSRRP